MKIKGITIELFEKIDEDEMGTTIYAEDPIEIPNVLVSPSNTTDLTEDSGLHGKKEVYLLAIPKGDEHCWEDAKVRFFGHMWKTLGFPMEGIEELIPLAWNKKVTVERYG